MLPLLPAMFPLRHQRREVQRAVDAFAAGVAALFILTAGRASWADVAAAAVSMWLRYGVGPAGFGLGDGPRDAQLFFAYSMLVTTAVVTLVWLTVTWLTPPADRETLVAFYRRTRPGRAGWRPIAALAPEVEIEARPAVALGQWALGCVAVYASLFGVGRWLFGDPAQGTVLLAVALGCAWVIQRSMRAP